VDATYQDSDARLAQAAPAGVARFLESLVDYLHQAVIDNKGLTLVGPTQNAPNTLT